MPKLIPSLKPSLKPNKDVTPQQLESKGLANRLLTLLWGLAVVLSAPAIAWDKQESVDPSSAACGSCHVEQMTQWQGSHHALAMQSASLNSVLGDFSTTAQHGDLAAKFSRNEQGAWVKLQEGDADPINHKVVHVFGVEPLQQYLTQASDGRFQVLPFAWDTRAESLGGQRWFSLFEPQSRPPTDRLHWQQPLQNWDGMCADCHTTNLQRQYDVRTDRFATQWEADNVGCLACHTPGNKTSTADAGLWERAPEATTASLSKPRDTSYMEGCAACHALRTPLTDGFQAGQPFLDHFRLSLLEPNLYHADGQIKEEVYVWGSFLQSKMFAQGVACNDCHNPHTLKLQATGDALCGQCHSLPQFAQVQHHGHEPGSSGSQCVNCHMPTTIYMGVDVRHDHKFVVPRPHVTLEFGVPNVCVDCHADKDANWAAQALHKLHGKPKTLTPNQQAVLTSQRSLPASSARPLSMAAINSVLADPTLPQITQASVLAQQARLLTPGEAPVSVATLARLADTPNEDALLALTALDIAKLLPADQRLLIAKKSLIASPRALRVAAADALLGAPIPSAAQSSFNAALVELSTAQAQTAWRGEGRMNLALTQQRLGNMAAAEQQYKQSVLIDPYFAPAYINLADLYRQQQRGGEAASLYTQALVAVPDDASLRYSYALHLVRVKQLASALVQSKRAVDLAVGDPQMATLYVLVLDGLGRTREGLLWLQANWASFAGVDAVRQLGMSLARKINDPLLYQWFREADS